MELKVLHVVQPTEGGAPRCAVDLAVDQMERGWSVTLACPPEEPALGWLHSAGIPHIEWSARRSPATAARETRRLGQIISAAKPDLVHLHSAKAGLAGRLAVRGSLPTVYQPHAWSFHAAEGAMRKAAVMWERRAARWTDVILCVSKGEANLGASAGIEGAFEVIPNGVDVEAWSYADDSRRADAREQLHLPPGPLAVCLGRITEQKGQDILLASWSEVEREVPGANLVLVGDGPLRSAWEPLAGSSVRFAGQSADPALWLAASDVVVLPSRWEGMSLSMLEAMACGRPVVASDVDGAAEAIGPDTGAIVPVGDVASLAREVILRLKDPARRVSEGTNARRRAEELFDRRFTLDRTASLYDKVLERRNF